MDWLEVERDEDLNKVLVGVIPILSNDTRKMSVKSPNTNIATISNDEHKINDIYWNSQ